MDRSRVRRVLWLSLVALIAIGSLFSGRREAVFALGLALLLLPLTVRGWLPWGGMALITALAVTLYLSGPLSDFFEARESVFDEFQGGGTGRWPLLVRSLELWRERPLWGYGPGTHVGVLWENSDLGEGGVASHNSITGNMLEAGVAGGAAVIWLLAGFFYSWIAAVRCGRGRPAVSWPGVMTAAAASIFVIAAVGDFVNHAGYTFLFALLACWWARMRQDLG